MTLTEYQAQAITTLTGSHEYGDITPSLMAQVLGLVGESGEVAEKFKKLIRDQGGKITEDTKAELIKELGDILWYIASVAHLLGTDIETIAATNLQKLKSRQTRGQIHGSGDNR